MANLSLRRAGSPQRRSMWAPGPPAPEGRRAGRRVRRVLAHDVVGRVERGQVRREGRLGVHDHLLAAGSFAGTRLLRADLRGATSYELHPVENALRGARVSLPDPTALLAALGIGVDLGP
jgi:hypothetical protein